VPGDIVNLHCSGSEGMTAGACNSISDSFPKAQHKYKFKGTVSVHPLLCGYKMQLLFVTNDSRDLLWARQPDTMGN
jgi:hypothetical protein